MKTRTPGCAAMKATGGVFDREPIMHGAPWKWRLSGFGADGGT